MERTTNDEIRNALSLALKYLEHPDVQAMNFALSSSVAARRLRAAVTEIEALIEHKRRAELVIEAANNELYKLRNALREDICLGHQGNPMNERCGDAWGYSDSNLWNQTCTRARVALGKPTEEPAAHA